MAAAGMTREAEPETRERLVPLSVRITVAQADALHRRAIKTGRSTGECLRMLLDVLLRERGTP